MSDFMKTLLKEFSSSIAGLQFKMKEINLKFDYESKINLVTEIKKKIKEDLNDKLKKIEKEYRDMGEKMRGEYKTQVDNIKNDHKRLAFDIEKLENKIKQDFLTVNPKKELPLSKDEKERLKTLAKKIDDQNIDLGSANKTQNNIISLQQNTILNLNEQGERLVGINNKLGEIEQNLTLTQQIVGVMSNRELFYRLKLAIIVLLLFLADIIVLYLKLL